MTDVLFMPPPSLVYDFDIEVLHQKDRERTANVTGAAPGGTKPALFASDSGRSLAHEYCKSIGAWHAHSGPDRSASDW